MRASLLLSLAFLFATDAFAAKKDFKGLFGSYRREKFTENEARSTDFGFDILVSTLLPLSPVVKSSENLTTSPTGEPLQYATSFNGEASLFMSMAYNWQLFLNLGYYSYDTRKQNTEFGTDALPLFHQFDMKVIPAIVGFKYRFGTTDIVPYLGAGGGVAYVERRASYDSNALLFDQAFSTVLTAQLSAGFEFYISPRAGIRLEASAMFIKLPAATFNPGGNPKFLPLFFFQPDPWAIRYASGLFILF